MKHEEILLICKKERDELRGIIRDAGRNAGWLLNSGICKKEIESAQIRLVSHYIDLLGDNLSDLEDELDSHEFTRLFDLYSEYVDGDLMFSKDRFPEEVLL